PTSSSLASKCISVRKSPKRSPSRARSEKWRRSCASCNQNKASKYLALVAAWELFTSVHWRADQANGGASTATNRLRSASAITLRQLFHPCASLTFESWSSLAVFL